MCVSLKSHFDQTFVIIGASNGIGLATAWMNDDDLGMVWQTSFYTRFSVLPGFRVVVAALLGLGYAALFEHEPKKKSWF